ncbi:hypothetical protein ACIA03_29120 [Nocardioides sp. NPDC051685]|uniref:hypothetical protein n=1 Tax=Nocardioides sp. NPDC051685 TaxID=3364334 RepID=UPI0037BD4579
MKTLARLVVLLITATVLGLTVDAATSQATAAPSTVRNADPSCVFVPAMCALDGAGEAAQGAVDDAVTSAVDSGARSLGEAMMGAWDALMKKFLTVWLDQGLLVDLEGDQVHWLSNALRTLTVPFAVIGIMIACVWTMMNHRGDRMRTALEALFRVFLVSTLGTAFVALMVPVGDKFGQWILSNAGVTVNGWQSAAAAGIVQTQPGLAILAGIFGALSVFFQWVIMLARVVVLPLLVAIWPTTAAAAMIRGGEQSFASVTRWIIAFLLYKPAAAIVYAFAWRLKSDDDISTVINGLLLLIMAVLALPVLLRLMTPAANAMGSAAGGGMSLAATGAIVATGVAAGAAIVTGGTSAAATPAAAGAGGGTSGGASRFTAGGTQSPTGGGPQPPAPAPGSQGQPGQAGIDGASSQQKQTAEGSMARGLDAGARQLRSSVAEGSQQTKGDDMIGGDGQ